MKRSGLFTRRQRILDDDLDDFYTSRKKSIPSAVFLAATLGPIGAIYGNPLGGAVLTLSAGLVALYVFSLAAIGGMSDALPIALIAVWAVSIALGTEGAYRHNVHVRAQAALWRWLLSPQPPAA